MHEQKIRDYELTSHQRAEASHTQLIACNITTAVAVGARDVHRTKSRLVGLRQGWSSRPSSLLVTLSSSAVD